MAAGVLLVIETSAGTLRDASLELIAPAAALANGGSVTAVVVGSGAAGAAQAVAERGVGHVLLADNAALERYTTDGYTAAIEAAIAAVDPAVVLLIGTTAGRDLGPYLAARAGSDCLSDTTALRWDGDTLVGTRPVYGGKMLSDVRLTVPTGGRAFAVLRAGQSAPPAAAGDTGSVEPLAVEIAADALRVRLTGVAEKPAGGVNLEGAEVVVVGGRGLGSKDAFGLVEQLAEVLHAPVGATRAVTDLGWRPHFEQIGQTGKTVRPKLYVGIGVSGAVQHTVGMQNSETIVSINRDADSPLVRMADIGVIGDLHALVPAITAAIKAAQG